MVHESSRTDTFYSNSNRVENTIFGPHLCYSARTKPGSRYTKARVPAPKSRATPIRTESNKIRNTIPGPRLCSSSRTKPVHESSRHSILQFEQNPTLCKTRSLDRVLPTPALPVKIRVAENPERQIGERLKSSALRVGITVLHPRVKRNRSSSLVRGGTRAIPQTVSQLVTLVAVSRRHLHHLATSVAPPRDVTCTGPATSVAPPRDVTRTAS